MKTFNRICIKDFTLTAENGDTLRLKRGQAYLTSAAKKGRVVVFTNFWVSVPAVLFAGALPLTLS